MPDAEKMLNRKIKALQTSINRGADPEEARQKFVDGLTPGELICLLDRLGYGDEEEATP